MTDTGLTCAKCGRTGLAPKDFYKNAARPGGVSTYCKDCTKKYNRTWQLEHPEEVASQKKRWRDENRGRLRDYQKRYYNENRDVVLERRRELRQEKTQLAEHGSRFLKLRRRYMTKVARRRSA